VNIIIL